MIRTVPPFSCFPGCFPFLFSFLFLFLFLFCFAAGAFFVWLCWYALPVLFFNNFSVAVFCFVLVRGRFSFGCGLLWVHLTVFFTFLSLFCFFLGAGAFFRQLLGFSGTLYLFFFFTVQNYWSLVFRPPSISRVWR